MNDDRVITVRRTSAKSGGRNIRDDLPDRHRRDRDTAARRGRHFDERGVRLATSGDDDGIFETEVRYNDGRLAVTVSAVCPGQFRINPRYQGMLYAGA